MTIPITFGDLPKSVKSPRPRLMPFGFPEIPEMGMPKFPSLPPVDFPMELQMQALDAMPSAEDMMSKMQAQMQAQMQQMQQNIHLEMPKMEMPPIMGSLQMGSIGSASGTISQKTSVSESASAQASMQQQQQESKLLAQAKSLKQSEELEDQEFFVPLRQIGK